MFWCTSCSTQFESNRALSCHIAHKIKNNIRHDGITRLEDLRELKRQKLEPIAQLTETVNVAFTNYYRLNKI